MSILSKEQVLEKIKSMIGENTDDDSITLIEDVTDTLNDYETKSKDTTDWEKKYKENDEAWRKKYRDRFFNSPSGDENDQNKNDDDDDDSSEKNLTYDKLFKEE